MVMHVVKDVDPAVFFFLWSCRCLSMTSLRCDRMGMRVVSCPMPAIVSEFANEASRLREHRLSTKYAHLLGLAKSQQSVKTSFGKVVCELKAAELDFPSSVPKTGLYRQ
jgi:hypothetical protein